MKGIVDTINRITELESVCSSQDTIETLMESFDGQNTSKQFDTVEEMFASINKEVD